MNWLELRESMIKAEAIRKTIPPLHGDRRVFRFADAILFRRTVRGFHDAVDLAMKCASEPVERIDAERWVRGL